MNQRDIHEKCRKDRTIPCLAEPQIWRQETHNLLYCLSLFPITSQSSSGLPGVMPRLSQRMDTRTVVADGTPRCGLALNASVLPNAELAMAKISSVSISRPLNMEPFADNFALCEGTWWEWIREEGASSRSRDIRQAMRMILNDRDWVSKYRLNVLQNENQNRPRSHTRPPRSGPTFAYLPFPISEPKPEPQTRSHGSNWGNNARSSGRGGGCCNRRKGGEYASGECAIAYGLYPRRCGT